MCIGAGAGSGSTRFRVPEKVPKVPVKVWEALVQSQVSFNRVPVPGGFGGKPGQVQRVPKKVPEKVLGGFGAEPGQVQQGSGEGSGEGLGGFGAQPVRCNRVPEKVPEKVWEVLVQSHARCNRVPEKVPEKVLGGFSGEGSGEGSGRLWCRARSGSTGFRRRFRRRSGRLL